jgi:DNA-binding MarR family transcriptional regulator
MFQIRETVGWALIEVMKAHRRLAEGLLGGCGLHAGQEMVLLRLADEDGLTQTQIAEHLRVEPPTVTKMLQRMETAGLVARRPCADDARVSRVYLTDESRALIAPVQQMWRELEARTVQGMTEAEQVLLRRLLIQVQRNLSEP